MSSALGKPNLDQGMIMSLNLKVLKKRDESVEEILKRAAQVTLYQFDFNTDQWVRKGIDGALFVVRRSTQPFYQFIVMNRRAIENFVEDLSGDFDFEIIDSILMYRNAKQEVIGIWFQNSKERQEVADCITGLSNVVQLDERSVSPSPSERSHVADSPHVSGEAFQETAAEQPTETEQLKKPGCIGRSKTTVTSPEEG